MSTKKVAKGERVWPVAPTNPPMVVITPAASERRFVAMEALARAMEATAKAVAELAKDGQPIVSISGCVVTGAETGFKIGTDGGAK